MTVVAVASRRHSSIKNGKVMHGGGSVGKHERQETEDWQGACTTSPSLVLPRRCHEEAPEPPGDEGMASTRDIKEASGEVNGSGGGGSGGKHETQQEKAWPAVWVACEW